MRKATQLIFVLLITLITTQALAADLVLENKFTKMTVKQSDTKLTATFTDIPSGKVYATQEVASASVGTIAKKTANGKLGNGNALLLTWKNGWKTTVALYDDSPFFSFTTTVVNSDAKPFVKASLPLFEAKLTLGKPLSELNFFGTGFLKPFPKSDQISSFSFAALADPATRNAVLVAQLNHDQSSSVFFAEKAEGSETEVALKGRQDFGRFQVEPKSERVTDTFLFGYFADGRLGLEAYADRVVKYYDIKLMKKPSVYCTWYHARASDEKKLAANTEFADKHLKPFGLDVMQIDDHWQKKDSSNPPAGWKSKFGKEKGAGPVKEFVTHADNFSKGMKWTADNIKKHGMTAGIWFMPFAGDHYTHYFSDKLDLFARWADGTPCEDKRWSGSLLDATNPKTQKFIYERTKRIYDWGYDYFKIDGMHTGAVTHNTYVNKLYQTTGLLNTRNFIGAKGKEMKIDSDTPSDVLFDKTKTHIQAYRIAMDEVRRGGPKAYILGCNVSQNMRSMGAAFDKINGMRIGPDNGNAANGSWRQATRGPSHGSNLYFLNDRVWHNDPDPVYVRTSNPMNKARWAVSWVAVAGSFLTVSEQFTDLPPERLDLIKRMLPPHSLKPRPVDLFDTEGPQTWVVCDDQSGVQRYVIGLFNWDEKKETTIEETAKRLGLDPKKKYVTFEFWTNEFGQPFTGKLSEKVAGADCRVLAVREATDHPMLLSTSRHIAQCVLDVLEEKWDAKSKTLSGKSKLVAGDKYEMRFALPEGVAKPKSLKATGADGKSIPLTLVDSKDKNGCRAVMTSDKSQEVKWELKF